MILIVSGYKISRLILSWVVSDMLEIAKEDILARLAFDNPWWQGKGDRKIRFEGFPRRRYFSPFIKLIINRDVQRAVVLMGPRRVGKTVMVFQAIRALIDEGVDPKSILYLSLETPLYTGLALEKLLGYFLSLHGHQRDDELYVFYDEVQYLKDWEVHLKSLVDSFPSYHFVVTGSAAAALRLRSQESGAGRFSDFVLPPLTFAEYLYFVQRENELVKVDRGKDKRHVYTANNIEELNKEFVNYINYGGYPEAVFSDSVRDDPGQYIKSDIIDKVLLRDLPSLYGISDIQELNRLFTTLVYNTGGEVSLEGLSKSSGVAKNTIKRYLEYLEAAFLIRRVERIDQNAKRFKRAMHFKVYLTNPTMRTALFGRLEEGSSAIGSMIETAIYSQWQHRENFDLFYARWPTGEVDIVSLSRSQQNPAWAIEVKWSDRLCSNHAELGNYVDFVEKNPSLKGTMMITSKTTEKNLSYKGVNFEFRPASLYAYLLGANILNYKTGYIDEQRKE